MSSYNTEEILIRLLLRRFNIPSCDYSGMKALSDIIHRNHGEKISVNTLARIAGLRTDSGKPYLQTLDILARSGTFSNYRQFEQFIETKSNLQLTDNKSVINPFIAVYTKEATANGDILFLKKLLSHIENYGCSPEEIYAISFAMVQGIRVNKNPNPIIKLLVNSPVSLDLFFETYIDRDHFAGYYGRAMVSIAAQTKETDRLYLLSNAIALHYEKETGNISAYKKRGKKLAALDDSCIDKMLKARWVYPLARWMGAASGFLYEQGMKKEGNHVIEKMMDCCDQLTPDEQMILLSETSSSSQYFDLPVYNRIVKIYEKNKDKIVLDFDSLINAGLNYMLVDKSKILLSPKKVEEYITRYPLQFSMNKNTIRSKAKKIFR
jgi:hypothetical protein